MRAVYWDASVVLRFAFQQPGALDLRRIDATPVSSELARVECFRTLDRLRLQGHIPESEARAGVALLSTPLDATTGRWARPRACTGSTCSVWSRVRGERRASGAAMAIMAMRA